MSNFFLEYKNLVSMRHRTGVGGVLLGALIIATPLLSWGSASSWLNTLLGLWQGAIVLLLLPEVKGLTVKIFKDSLAFKLTGFLLFFSLIGMLVFNFDALMETRTWIYCIQPFFFIAMVSWFSTDTDAKMLFICICKIISVGFVTLVLFCL